MSVVRHRRTSSLLLLVTLVMTICVCACFVRAEDEPKACHLPGDLVFVLDESGSIWGPAFLQQLEFVELVADTFDISPNHTHIGVMTFASDTNIVFHLDAYNNRLDVKHAIRKITQRRGGTQTHKALADMREKMFSPEHSRSSAAHVAIVITDGESEEPPQTAFEAKLAHDSGIHVIAIGVGPHVIMDELKLIASSPDLVFTAPEYAALQPLRNRLAWKACEVLTSTTTTTTTTTTTAPPPMIEGCASRESVDIIWSLPNEAGSSATDSVLNLVSAVAGDLEIGPQSIQVGVAPRVCSDDKPAIRLRDHDTVDGFRAALDDRRVADTTNIEKQLEYLRTQGFVARNGARSNVIMVAVLVIDRRSSNPEAVKRELTKARRAGIKFIVIGVGKDINNEELKMLASDNEALLLAESYADLATLHVALIQRICTAIRGAVYLRRALYEYGFLIGN